MLLRFSCHPVRVGGRFFSSNISKNTFIHPSSILIGNVKLGNNVSVWPNVVLRGDVNPITIGDNTNVQDGTVIHVTGNWDGDGGAPTLIGSRVSIGHLAMLHGCIIHDDVLIGMKSMVMDKSTVSSNVIIGAGSLVPPGKVLESGFLYVGSPVKKIRELKPEELLWIQNNWSRYVELKNRYINGDFN